jgi:membrane protease subunit HflC
MNSKNSGLIISLIVVGAIILFNCLYVLSEGKQAVITQFGDPIGGAIVDAGLHFKLPWQKVNLFEKRLLEWDGDPNQIPTKDKKYIAIDTTARWKIENPLKFFQSVFDERGGQGRLDDIIDAAVRDAVTSHNLIEMVRSTNRLVASLEKSVELKEFIEESALEKINVGREKMRKEILETARELAPQYGIDLVDVRIKRVNYVEEVKRKVYERMIAERKRAAEKYRSEGRGTRAEIEGQTEKELKGILSQAYKKSQEVKGEADAKSTEVYAQAYNQDPEFFAFLKTLETYKTTIDKATTIILTTDSEYFSYLKEISPE